MSESNTRNTRGIEVRNQKRTALAGNVRTVWVSINVTTVVGTNSTTKQSLYFRPECGKILQTSKHGSLLRVRSAFVPSVVLVRLFFCFLLYWRRQQEESTGAAAPSPSGGGGGAGGGTGGPGTGRGPATSSAVDAPSRKAPPVFGHAVSGQ